MRSKDIIIIILVAAVAILGTYIFMQSRVGENPSDEEVQVTDFDECVAAGNPVMESYPEQCTHNGKTFINKNVTEQFTEQDSDSSGEEKLIGGDKDEHGCLIAAGYTWCEEKEKCLRTWEEECEEDKKESITSAMADKHEKDESDVTITITTEEGDYVRGGVEFAPGGLGNAGMFLATKVGDEWEIVYDGHGVADCDELIDDYGFPMSVLTGICE